MEIQRARFLLSEPGRAALRTWSAGASKTLDPLRLATALRRDFPPAEASALAEQITLRGRAARNHGVDRDWLYTADGLEMMTHPLVAERRAGRVAGWQTPALDLTAGLGGDLAALVRAGAAAFGLERDAVHALFAGANSGAPVVRGDAARPPFAPEQRAVLLDPSRRAGGSRRFNPEAFTPPWNEVVALASQARAAVIKAPPGLAAELIPPAAELEAVQLGTSMRETTLWLGGDAVPGLRRAVLLPAGATLASSAPEAPAEPAPPAPVVYDPESCVTRATLVTHLGHALGARLMDPHIAYLTSGTPAFSPFAATFEVLDVLPFSVSKLKVRLRAGNWRPDEIRRRAFPVEPDELRRLLGRLDGDPVTLLLTTLGSSRTVFICRRLFAPA